MLYWGQRMCSPKQNGYTPPAGKDYLPVGGIFDGMWIVKMLGDKFVYHLTWLLLVDCS